MKSGSSACRLTEFARMLMVVGFGGGVSACCCRYPPPTTNSQRPASVAVVHFTCPGDPVVIDIVDVTTGAVLKTVNGIPPSEPITDIPEFHDCQRLVSGGAYDSLYAIFASFRLESLPSTFGHDSSVAAPAGRQYGIVPVATIYSHGGEYTPLGIKPGFNCLFFFRRYNTNGWSAKMVPWGGSTDPDCGDRPYDPYTTIGTELEVKPLDQSSFGPKDFPGVARWDWDAENRQHYIGIACGSRWCEVGKLHFVSSQAYSTPSLTWKGLAGVAPSTASPEFHRVFKVKGWYDEQRIELLMSGTMTPGPYGFLIPHPLLDSINEAGGLGAYRDNWSHVANAVVRGAYPKWNFTNGENEIFFCYGTSATCGVSDNLPRVPGSSTMLSKCPQDPTNHDLRWWAMIVSAANDTAYVCVERTDHSGQLATYKDNHPDQTEIRIPGAARWRYLPNDAGGWVSCPTGCCTIKN